MYKVMQVRMGFSVHYNKMYVSSDISLYIQQKATSANITVFYTYCMYHAVTPLVKKGGCIKCTGLHK